MISLMADPGANALHTNEPGMANDPGMELRDLLTDTEFLKRQRHAHDLNNDAEAFRHLAQLFGSDPQIVLQELVNIAVTSCGADSAGISLEEPPDASGQQKFRWIAIAGSFSTFLHGTTPRLFSPCGTCLDRNQPQLYRVSKPYYDFLGIEAAPIVDGILIPWLMDNVRGTLWAVSHKSREAFDSDDYRLLSNVASFAALALRHQIQERDLRKIESLAARTALAHQMAHEINNPLQTLTNLVYLAENGTTDMSTHLPTASSELKRLTDIVKKLLELPVAG